MLNKIVIVDQEVTKKLKRKLKVCVSQSLGLKPVDMTQGNEWCMRKIKQLNKK